MKNAHKWKRSHAGVLERCIACGTKRRVASARSAYGAGSSTIMLYRAKHSAIWSTFRPDCGTAREMRAAKAAAGLVRRHMMRRRRK